ncbi:MAG: hypothetical protein RLZ07_1346 [Pseudomonadota bacterium]
MIERVDRIGAVLNGCPSKGRRVAGYFLAYFLFFASIFSAAHTVHAKGAPLDLLHAVICSVGEEGASTPQMPASQGPDKDLSCCTMGFGPQAVLPPSSSGFNAPTHFAFISKILPAYETQEGYPLSAPGMSRAPPFMV